MKNEIITLPIEKIVANPHQPRQVFNEESLRELSESIKNHGLIQPIVVRQNNQGLYELIAGERRLRASKLASFTEIQAIVKESSNKDSAYLALIENIQRDDLHFIEVAKSYKELMADFQLSQTELVNIVGKSQSAIANKLRILNLSDEVLSLIMDNKLTERHGRALLKVKDTDLQINILKHIIKQNMTVNEAEKYIEKKISPKKEPEKKPEIKRFIKDIRLFTNTIKQAVDAINSSGMDAKYTVRQDEDKYTITIDIPYDN